MGRGAFGYATFVLLLGILAGVVASAADETGATVTGIIQVDGVPPTPRTKAAGPTEVSVTGKGETTLNFRVKPQATPEK